MNAHILVFIFAFGSVIGWVLEFFWRFVQEKKIPHFGFCYGPYLPIYGIGTMLLYIISLTQIPLWSKFILFPVACTGLELVVGLFFLKLDKKLWDYSERRWNYKGVISAFHCFAWFFLGITFYYGLFPYFVHIPALLQNSISWPVLGTFYVAFSIDVIFSIYHIRKS